MSASETMAKTDNQPVKLENDVYRKAKVIATARKIPLSKYLSDLLRPLVDGDLAGALEMLGEEFAPDGEPKRRRGKRPPPEE